MRFGFREIIFLVVLLAVPVASFLYVFKPRNDEIIQAREEIEIKRARLEQLEAMTSQIEDIGLAIEQGRQSILMIETKLPDSRDVEGILDGVWQLAKSASLTVKSVKSQKPVPAAAYMELPLLMVLEGQFDGFYQFLLELENLPRITRIQQLSIERLGSGVGPQPDAPPGSMKAEFTLSIYFEDKAKKPNDGASS